MKYLIKIQKHLQNTHQVKFSIDSPRDAVVFCDANNFIRIKGWVVDPLQPLPILVVDGERTWELRPTIDRPDVAKAHGLSNTCCGFEIYIEAAASCKIGIRNDSSIVWLVTLEAELSCVVEGKDNYLFLEHDSNRSSAQYLGQLLIDKANMDQWHDYFAYALQETSASNIDFRFMLAPGKEYIFPEHYPYLRGGATPTDQFLNHFGHHRYVLNPLLALHKQRNYSYSKIDTHWTHYGASIAARFFCESIDVNFIDPEYDYKFRPSTGDLGNKLFPNAIEYLPHFDEESISRSRIFENRIPNRGRLHIYENLHVSGNNVLIVFGDSFSMLLVPQLIKTFKRVVHVFSGADIDWEIVRHEKPTHILAEITSRFLIKAPNPKFSLKSELSRKVRSMPLVERQRLMNHLERFSVGSVSYYRRMLVDVINSSD